VHGRDDPLRARQADGGAVGREDRERLAGKPAHQRVGLAPFTGLFWAEDDDTVAVALTQPAPPPRGEALAAGLDEPWWIG
jgi:hypothetical protein